eukprot:13143386-Ditylum_brightwellii.AAC.1
MRLVQKAKACVEGRDTSEGTKGKLRNRVIQVKDISRSEEITQHKEEYGEDEEDHPKNNKWNKG